MKIIFMGTPDFAVSTLEALEEAGHELVLAVTQPDKPKGRGKLVQFSPVKEWGLAHGVPVYQPRRIRSEAAYDYLSRFGADIIVVAAFGQILPKEILEMPRYGCVNVHASLLPKYRGAAPIQWAVLNGDQVTGVTTMQMGVGLDDGDMLLKEVVKIAPDETGGSLFDKLARIGGELCVKTLEGLEQGTIVPQPQDEAQATHVGMIKKSMGKMDFDRPAVELERQVRGLNPWPSAFCSLDGKTLKVWKASVKTELPAAALETGAAAGGQDIPGTVVCTDVSGIWVRAKEDYLVLKEVQLEGKRRMKAIDFLRGHDVAPGTRLM